MFETKELNGEKLEINQDFFGQRIEYVNDSNIFLVCFNSDFSVEQIKKDDDEWTVADTYGPKGQGPNEIFTTNVCFSNKGDTLILYDANSVKALIYDLESDSKTCRQLNIFDNIPDKAQANHPKFFNDSTLICKILSFDKKDTSEESEVWFGLININNKEYTPLYGFSIEDESNTSLITKQIAYSPGYMAKRPSSDKFALCYTAGQVLQIFDIDDNRIKNIKLLKDDYPSYYLERDNSIVPSYKDKDKDSGLTDGLFLTATDDYIYVLPSRYTTTELKDLYFHHKKIDKFEGPAKGYLFMDEVWVYDWNGNQVFTLQLNPMVSSIGVTSDNKYIYGLSEDEEYEPCIMRYDTGL